MTSKGLREEGSEHLLEVRDVNRTLLEKAMHMRCVSYWADAKAQLLVRTVSGVGASKRAVLGVNQRLEREIELRERVEDELRKVTRAVDAAPIMIAMSELDGALVHANEAFRVGLGDDTQEGGNLFELLSRGAVPQAVAALRSAAAERSSWGGQLVYDRGSSKPSHLRVHLDCYDGGQGEDELAVIFLEDVTAEREAQERLLRAQRLEVIGELTGGVAHDFNNLLNIMMTEAELLLESPELSHNARERARSILATTERGATLTRQLLAFARRQVLESKRTSVTAVLSRVADLVRRTLGSEHPLEVRATREPDSILCDPGQLETALLNLIINARDALPQGGAIRVSSDLIVLHEPRTLDHGQLELGPHLRITVADRGVGIPAELLERVWEPFVSAKAGRHHSGLGLSMVLGFVEQSGGAVELESEEGRGTAIRLWFPKMDESVREDSGRQSTVPGEHARTVLLVEDDAQLYRLLRVSLERLGFDVRGAADLASAGRIVESEPHLDLVVCDMVLEGGDRGTDVARVARERHPELPCLLISGYAFESLAEDPILQEPGVATLSKPFRKATLEAKLRALLGASPSGTES